MIPMLGYKTRLISVATLCLVATVAAASPYSAYADDKNTSKHHHKHQAKHSGKQHGRQKERMTICHYDVDGTYSEKTLPVRAAMKHLAKHELDKEPVIGDDNSESCVTVEEPPTTCRVPFEGTEYTVNEYLASQNLTVARFETTAGFCRLILNDTTGQETADTVFLYSNADGAGLDIYFGVGNQNRLLIDSAEQYQDCAYDIETAAQTDELCPDLVALNP